jgi:hypothetical protein
MWRYLVGSGATLVLVLAGMFLFRGSAATEKRVGPPPPAQAAAEPLPDAAPSASDRTREEKRFDRLDKDRDQTITKDEYFAQRRKAFAKLDTNQDGKLSFDEWAIRNSTKFTGADKDKSGTLNRAEFATTAVKRSAFLVLPVIGGNRPKLTFIG